MMDRNGPSESERAHDRAGQAASRTASPRTGRSPFHRTALVILTALVLYQLVEELAEVLLFRRESSPWLSISSFSIASTLVLGGALTWLARRLRQRERELEAGLERAQAARESAEQDLVQRLEERTALFEALPDLFFKMKLDGTIVDYQAHRSADLYAQSSNFLGARMQDILPGPVSEIFEKALRRLVGHQTPGAFEYTLRMPDGEHPFEARMVPLGKEHVVAVVREISDRRRAERELERYRKNLEQLVQERTKALGASQAKLREAERLASVGTLAAGIAHQLNNPLGSILAAAQFAERYRDASDAAEVTRESLETVILETVRCGQIVKQLLKLSRGQPTLREEVESHSLVHHCMNMCAPYARERGVKLEPGEIASNATIFASPLELEEALVNLLRNAIEASPRGGAISISVTAAGEHVSIAVRDSGPGIDPDAASHALDPFFTTRLIEGGTGLGLSVAHRVVQAHGGELHLENAPEGGAVVRIELPVSSGEAGEDPAPARVARDPDPGSHL